MTALLQPAPATARHWTASQDKRLIDFVSAHPERTPDYWERARDYVGRACWSGRVRQRWYVLCELGLPRAAASARGRPQGGGASVGDVLKHLQRATQQQVGRRYGISQQRVSYIAKFCKASSGPTRSQINEDDIRLGEEMWREYEKSQQAGVHQNGH